MKEEYIVINKTELLKKIEELEEEILYHHKKKEYLVCKELSHVKLSLEEILSESTPLIPEIEKAFDSSWFKAHGVMANKEKEKQDYILNLKLDI